MKKPQKKRKAEQKVGNNKVLKEEKTSESIKENFNKMPSETKYFWGLFIICFFMILFLLKGYTDAFYWVAILLFIYIILKDQIKKIKEANKGTYNLKMLFNKPRVEKC